MTDEQPSQANPTQPNPIQSNPNKTTAIFFESVLVYIYIVFEISARIQIPWYNKHLDEFRFRPKNENQQTKILAILCPSSSMIGKKIGILNLIVKHKGEQKKKQYYTHIVYV